MQTLGRIVVSIAAALIAAFLGGCVGFLVARILAEGLGLVEGPPAGVLLVLSVASFALVSLLLGFILPLRWLRKRRTHTP
jgi:glycopeptide antibiotics resistance protein